MDRCANAHACSGCPGPVGSASHFTSSPMPILRFIPEATNINFVGARYIAFAIDGLPSSASAISFGSCGSPNWLAQSSDGH